MITLDVASPVPPFEQVRTQLADLIRTGALAGDHRLPSIRQLAGDLRIAPGTVARAYRALETDGLIESNRARGTRVRKAQAVNAELGDAAATFVTAARQRDATLEDALSAVRATWEQPGSSG